MKELTLEISEKTADILQNHSDKEQIELTIQINNLRQVFVPSSAEVIFKGHGLNFRINNQQEIIKRLEEKVEALMHELWKERGCPSNFPKPTGGLTSI